MDAVAGYKCILMTEIQPTINELQKKLESINPSKDVIDEWYDRSENTTTQTNLRHFTELSHRLNFFIAACYHSLGIEEMETLYYSIAQDIRQKLLSESVKDVDALQSSLQEEIKKNTQEIDKIGVYILEDHFENGIHCASIFKSLDNLKDILNTQIDLLNEWRKELHESLLRSPVASTESDDKGEEQYGDDIDKQNALSKLLDAFRFILNDRIHILKGTHPQEVSSNPETQFGREEEIKDLRLHPGDLSILTNISMLKRIALNEKYKVEDISYDLNLCIDKLTIEREVCKGTKSNYFINSLEYEKRALQVQLNNHKAELQLCGDAITYFTKLVKDQTKVIDIFIKEYELSQKTFNFKIIYFKQLQELSDRVRSLTDEIDVKVGEENCSFLVTRQALELKQIKLIAHSRFLQNIKILESTRKAHVNQTLPECVICYNKIKEGFLTACAHIYCLTCAELWPFQKRVCAICNQSVSRIETKCVTFFKEQGVFDRANPVPGVCKGDPIINEIKSTIIIGDYGTKIDMIIKHIKYLISIDTMTKMVIFTQESNVLRIIEYALFQNEIGSITLDKSRKKKSISPVAQFINNPEISVILLGSKSQSSGLTLTFATHVFIVEPQLNYSTELQGILRI